MGILIFSITIIAAKSSNVPSKPFINYFNSFTKELKLPSLPEMLFGDNCLKIEHQAGFGIEFNALDALKLVDSERDLIKVAYAQEWQNSR